MSETSCRARCWARTPAAPRQRGIRTGCRRRRMNVPTPTGFESPSRVTYSRSVGCCGNAMSRSESTEPSQVPEARSRIGAAGVEDSLAAGRDALLRAAWAEARARFEDALAVEETVEALEGLGVAARWQMDGPAALAVHERAYRLAREEGDEAAAARLAIELTFD